MNMLLHELCPWISCCRVYRISGRCSSDHLEGTSVRGFTRYAVKKSRSRTETRSEPNMYGGTSDAVEMRKELRFARELPCMTRLLRRASPGPNLLPTQRLSASFEWPPLASAPAAADTSEVWIIFRRRTFSQVLPFLGSLTSGH